MFDVKKLILLGLVVSLVAFSGCTEDQASAESSMTMKEGILVVGTDPTFPPFEEKNADGELVGFDIDLMKALGEKMGLEIQFVEQPFDGIIPALKAEKFDCIISAVTITDDRAKEVAFTNSYFDAAQVIAVLVDDESVQSVDDLAGKVVAAQLGTTGEYEAQHYAEELGFEIKSYEVMADAFIDMENGRVDAVVTDDGVAQRFLDTKPGFYKVVGEPMTAESYGLAANLDNQELIDALNAALSEVKEDGTYDEIYAEWFDN
ncbi:basic amino acid ABC transporter substrate-binding protein [Methanococcus maripaludis]|uniref:Polar amino acid transport system substrate-binding protein n=2 Tax=Methanococcus maripaludis TaxID=39152 RepID=A0A7J9PI19_METMI|nr:basic amino acid ABC transporter substrate-binding protein [Methanococcus maripaludis]MBA2862434.1 polar amino acid transport system substrate-binding protein [Methanococcus maripaludis]